MFCLKSQEISRLNSGIEHVTISNLTYSNGDEVSHASLYINECYGADIDGLVFENYTAASDSSFPAIFHDNIGKLLSTTVNNL